MGLVHLISSTIPPKKQQTQRQGHEGYNRLKQQGQHNTPHLWHEVKTLC